MNKLTHSYRYFEACCLRDYIFKVCLQARPTPAQLLAAAIATHFAVKLSQKLVLRFNKTKRISITYPEAVALYILSTGKKIGQYTDLEIAVVLPLIKDVESKIIFAPTNTSHDFKE